MVERFRFIQGSPCCCTREEAQASSPSAAEYYVSSKNYSKVYLAEFMRFLVTNRTTAARTMMPPSI